MNLNYLFPHFDGPKLPLSTFVWPHLTLSGHDAMFIAHVDMTGLTGPKKTEVPTGNRTRDRPLAGWSRASFEFSRRAGPPRAGLPRRSEPRRAALPSASSWFRPCRPRRPGSAPGLAPVRAAPRCPPRRPGSAPGPAPCRAAPGNALHAAGPRRAAEECIRPGPRRRSE